VLGALCLPAPAKGASDAAIDLDLSRAHSPHSIKRLASGPHGLEVVTDGPDPYFELPVERRLEGKKVRIEFADLTGFDRVQIFYGIEDWPYSEARQSAVRPGRGSRVARDFPLPDGWHRAVRIDLDPATGRGPAHIARITIVESNALDHPIVPYAAALAIGVSLLLPGALLIAIAARREPDDDAVPLLGFAATLIFYLIGLLVLLLTRGGPAYPDIVPAVVAGTFLVLVVLAGLRRRLHATVELISRQPVALAAYTVVVMAACHVVIADTPLPFSNLHYQSISGPKTFGAFRAHDNVFQYVNGAALADNEPLSEPYRDGRLAYLPQDREILPGAVYSVYRVVLAFVDADLGESFLTYTLFAIACNAMIVFPLIVFIRRYLRPPPAAVLAAVCLTAYVVVNAYFAWFKFSGAALFLSGLLVLLGNEERSRGWLGAGALWGLSASMHAGNALGMPIYFAWFVIRRLRSIGARSARTYLYPASFCVLFVAVNLPWAAVKYLYYPDNHALLRSFLIAGYHHPDGLFASIRSFFAETPLRDQLLVRLGNLYGAFRVEEILAALGLLLHGKFDQWLLQWDALEFSRTAVLMYPLLGFLALSRLADRSAGRDIVKRAASFAREAPEATALLWLGGATLLSIVLIAFGRFAPDITYHQPAGVILLVYCILAARVLASHGVVVALFLTYLAFSALRLGLFL
jgi:hypothetical protein